MKSKANDNLKSAQILIDAEQYTTSIHCSYYAVLEYMKYMLAEIEIKPINYENQNSNIGADTHTFILDEIKKRIKNPKNARNFVEGVRFLKRERVQADYELRKFSDVESLDCIQNASGLITNLKTYFGNI